MASSVALRLIGWMGEPYLVNPGEAEAFFEVAPSRPANDNQFQATPFHMPPTRDVEVEDEGGFCRAS